MNAEPSIPSLLDEIYRREGRRIFASLVRLLKDFDRAEEALHDAFAAAAEQWPLEGVPEHPRAWLVSTGRFKAVDKLRRDAKYHSTDGALANEWVDPNSLSAGSTKAGAADQEIADDQLRLIFTCCHPAIAPATQIALTLREVCGLTTEEIGRAFLVPQATIAQRIVRGKSKIRDAGIPFVVPGAAEMASRLDTVLTVVYLVFNEAYSSAGDSETGREDISQEGIRLGRLLAELLPTSEVYGLLALMLIQDSRRAARVSASGDLILLDEQDRTLWNREQIVEGLELIQRAFAVGEIGHYTLQAAIAAEHAVARSPAETNWPKIVGLYDALLRADPSPVVELNRAVAIAMRFGPQAGLDLMDRLLATGDLKHYHLLHAARADLYRRLGQTDLAIASYLQALDLTTQDSARRFMKRRLDELRAPGVPDLD